MKKIMTWALLILLSGCATGSLPTPQQLTTETFAECPVDYKEKIINRINNILYAPYSATYKISTPEKYVYDGEFGHRFFVEVRVKNHLGIFINKHFQLMCFSNGIISEINSIAQDL